MGIFEIALETVKWGVGLSIGGFTLFVGWAIVIGIIKGIAEGISG